MADTFVNAQKPIKQEGVYYYPPTTAKQVILPDGRRLGSAEKLNLVAEDVGALSIDTSNGIQGEAAPANADMLGGINAEEYATKDMIPEGVLSLDPDDVMNPGSEITVNAGLLAGMTYEQIKQDMINAVRPVGDLYFSYTGDDPNLRWTWQTWERVQDAYIHTSVLSTDGTTLTMNQVPALVWRRTK